MKKVVLFFAVVAAFALASCSDPAANTQNAAAEAAEDIPVAVRTAVAEAVQSIRYCS